VVQIPPVELEGWPFPVPSLITDFLISMNDKYMYLSNWLHGDVRQYDINDPAHPVQTGQVWLRSLVGDTCQIQEHKLEGGSQMLQLSLDGRRLYVTNSLFSSWDNQFYPKLAKNGSYIVQIACDPEKPGMKINENFYVDFSQEPGGPARAHEVRYLGGDCTTDIWL
jgi:selenium-binding protein 1